MSKNNTVKTGLMLSALSGRICYGRMNTKTGTKIGEPVDVTSDFYGILLQKHPINTAQVITANDKPEAEIWVVDLEKARRLSASDKMLAALQNLENDNGAIPETAWQLVQEAIKVATGGEA